MNRLPRIFGSCIAALLAALSAHQLSAQMAQAPLISSQAVAPLVLLTVGRDEKLSFPAYNDYSDIDGDGVTDVGYKPNILYYGYFDSYKCYSYVEADEVFRPIAATSNKKCSGAWSGDFLNYLTTSRIDALRRVLYGGRRVVDTPDRTVLERQYIPQDLHTWGREYDPAVDTYLISDYTPLAQPTSGTRHLFANTTRDGDRTRPLLRVLTNRTERIWNWVAKEGPVADTKLDGSGATVRPTDYVVRVEACVRTLPLESECKSYVVGGVTTYKPTGVLHDFGENRSIAFGLLTGSYQNQRAGGVLRKNISFFDNEVNLNGTFKTSVEGIVYHLDRIKIAQWGRIYPSGCLAGNCKDFGSPTAEMMYEGLRYFGGGAGATPDYDYTAAGSVDSILGLRKASWLNPYRSVSEGGFPYCAKPIQMVFSDVYPSYDSDQLPGSAFGSFSAPATPGTLSGMNVAEIAASISSEEKISGRYFIGESLDNTPIADRTPSAKNVTSLGRIRGLAPSEPTRQGSYYAASVARFGKVNDINSAPGQQNVTTYSIALSAPLPKLSFKVGDSTVSLIPFAQSVGGCNYGDFKVGVTSPMQNRIAAFFIDRIVNLPGFATDPSINGSRPWGRFRVSYEDNIEGTDSDMDAIANYTFEVTDTGQLRIQISSEYAAGCIDQHMGFVIQGTTEDGSYLGVRDVDGGCRMSPLNDAAHSIAPGKCPGGLGFKYDRTFTIASAASVNDANIPRDPLFYAAKWGGPGVSTDGAFTSATETVVGGSATVPGYFFVNDPIRLRAQLNAAFTQIQNDSAPTTTAAVSGSSLRSESGIYLPGYLTRRLTVADATPEDIGPVAGSTVWEGTLSARRYDLSSNAFTPWWSVNNASFGTVDSAAKTSTRVIYTPIGTNLTARFLPANLDATLRSQLAPISVQTLLNSYLTTVLGSLASATDRLNEAADQVALYILGDRRLEIRRGGTLRNRQNLLGDIVNSSPVYQGPTDFGWGNFTNLTEATSYPAFVANKKTKGQTVYVGANDGLLHAFDATTGKERWAYLPRALQGEVWRLVDPAYTHRYFVDGQLTIADAYWGGSWKTVLVAAMGAGAKSIVAIDVTDPSVPKVLWEFTHPDLGYVLGRPQVVRLADGKWVAVVANGYESARPDGATTVTVARLFLLDLSASSSSAISIGSDAKLTVPAQGVKNGLGTPAIALTNGIARAAWAGDLNGNLWKFDFAPTVTSNTAASVAVAYDRAPLFTAEVSGRRQPITAEPSIVPFVEGGDFLIFGTGKFFETTDPANRDQQTLYGIWDRSRWNSLTRSNLATGTLTDSGTSRFIAGAGNWWASESRGWRIDLTLSGERVVAPAVTVFGVSLIPTLVTDSTDPCVLTQDGTLLALNPFTGNAPPISVFDVNGDGVVNDSDKSSGGKVVAGVRITDPISVVTVTGGSVATALTARGTTAAEIKFKNVLGRRSWRLVQ